MPKELEAGEAHLWQRWRVQADEAARQELLALHLPYARIVAGSYFAKRRHPSEVRRELRRSDAA